MCLDQDHQRVASNDMARLGRVMLAVVVLWPGFPRSSVAEPLRQDVESAIQVPLAGLESRQGLTSEQGASLDAEPVASPQDEALTDSSWSLGDAKRLVDTASEAALERQLLQQAFLREAALFRDQELLRQDRDAQLIAQRKEAIEPNQSGTAERPQTVRWDLGPGEPIRLAALLQFLKEYRVLLLCLAIFLWIALRWRYKRTAPRHQLGRSKRRRIRKRIKVRIRRRIGGHRSGPVSGNPDGRMSRS